MAQIVGALQLLVARCPACDLWHEVPRQTTFYDLEALTSPGAMLTCWVQPLTTETTMSDGPFPTT
jgi:hypothetical protein